MNKTKVMISGERQKVRQNAVRWPCGVCSKGVGSNSLLCPGLPRWAGTRKVKPIWILLKQETASGSGISWAAICKSAPRSRQITMPVPHRSVFYRPDALPAAQPTVSKYWRNNCNKGNMNKTKVISGEHQKVMQNAVRWPCGVCRRGVGSNSLQSAKTLVLN